MTIVNGNSCNSDAAEPIAIVSAACRLPGHASSPHKLWELLQACETAVSHEVPTSRFDSAGHFDGSGRPGTLKAISGMFIEDIDLATFDAQFFNLTRADATAMDPQQRQLLEVVYECFENGGIPMEQVAGAEIGCFVGSYVVDYHDMQNRSPGQRPPGLTVGIGRAILSNRISHFYNLRGPSWTIDTACSGGLVGIDAACQYLRAGKISGAIVAASNLWMSPEHLQELGTMRAAYSPSGKCHSFDAKADGYCRAEGVNAVYLKRLADAIRDGDPVRAVIRGTANNSDGWTHGINSPSSDAQAAVIRAAYVDAGIDSSHYATTGYLECHSTGTPVGDACEVRGAASVLAQMRPPSEPLIIGSIKSNIGHSEPASGISGLIKAMMAVEHGRIPGNPTFFSPHPDIDFEGLHVRATRPGIPWPKPLNHYRRASINSFGYGGSNAHAVVDNTEHYLQQSTTPLKRLRPYTSSYVKPSDLLSLAGNRGVRSSSKKFVKRPQVLVFSANDQDSLKRQIEALSAHLLDPRVRVTLSDLSYTLSHRRSRHFCRGFLLGYASKSGHASSIEVGSARFAKAREGSIRIAFVFVGQGAQWSQMGAELVRMFPETAKRMLEELDGVLQELPASLRPEWSLVRELTEPRSSEHLSKAEFSQPIVTALQLSQLSVLNSWNVYADVVVGHSSGEIAAACSAGLITPKQAILIAYFRGLAAKEAVLTKPLGMLAVGLGANDVQHYLDATGFEDVTIACYNSPASVTLSGPSALLAELVKTIKADGHLARILQVELAYHSYHMGKIANYYEDLLTSHGKLEDDGGKGSVGLRHMVSTVTEDLLTEEARDPAYWKANMMSPVRFDSACRKMISDKTFAANFLIEIGPSNTLSGPVAQVVKETGIDHVTYAAASKRGQDSVLALFDVAGQLFLHDAEISLRSVNSDEAGNGATMPAVIIDLPNYKWNHSSKYWHESLASKDWRFRKFTEHDVLGSKVPGTLWQSPSWHKTLRLSDVPWLRDHKIGSEILFPAAGYIAMALEAVRQTFFSTATNEELAFLKAREYHYCLRDVRFSRGLVLEEDVDVNLMLLLVPMAKLGPGWWEYKIMSSTASDSTSSPGIPEKWNQNCNGLIRLELDVVKRLPMAPQGSCALPLKYPASGKLWYKAMLDCGYSYGPDFQKLLAVECMEGKSSSRALVSLEPPRSKWEPQSEYPLHPAPLDGCIQSVFIPLHRGIRSNFDKVLLPSSIDMLTVSGQTWHSNEAVLVATSMEASSDASVYDPTSGALIMDLKGVKFSVIDVQNSIYLSHTYAQLAWKPDFNHLDSDERLQQALSSVSDNAELQVQELLDLAAHKLPNLRVLEFNLVPEKTESLWLAADLTPRFVRAALGVFHFASDNANTVLAAQQRYSESPAAQNAHFSLLDPFSKTFSPPQGSSEFDLVVVRWSHFNYDSGFERLVNNIHQLLAVGGSVILCDPGPSTTLEGEKILNGDCILQHFKSPKFKNVRQTLGGSFIVAEVGPNNGTNVDTASAARVERDLVLVHFSITNSLVVSEISARLQKRGWNLTELHVDDQSGLGLAQLPSKSSVIVLDEIAQPLLATATEKQWKALKLLIQEECDLLWVTQGSQIEPTAPLKAICHGVLRTVRAEAPMLRIMTLDLESAALESLTTNAIAIDAALRELKSERTSPLPAECEFAERRGLLHISRIWPDELVNQFKIEDDAGGPLPRVTDLHASKATIRLVTDRPGTLDALHFAEATQNHSEMQIMEPDEIEVELSTSGCNYRDAAVAVGIISKNPNRLGSEGAGVVVRIGSSVTDRHVGQRVAVFCSGCFANRVTVSSMATLPLPDTMAFKEAATLPVAFLTSIYGVHHLAKLQSGQRVLIHSDVEGVGIACIQICQRLNCEVFVTEDAPEKREFLVKECGLREDHVISSRSTDFAAEIRKTTKGYGVDVVINSSVTRNLLRENWRLLSPGGTLIGIENGGLENGDSLFLEPFAPNCSFQGLDITALPLETIAGLFLELSRLIQDGHVKPISPCQVFGYEEIPKGLQLLREGNHFGKIVISNDAAAAVSVPTRPAKRLARSLLNPDHSYLFVGGLKGVCGSLAVHLATKGAKHISVMSRSSYEDNVSRSVAHNIRSLGCSLVLVRGDVTSTQDVRRCFDQISIPIGGIIQGAAVFRDQTFEFMSHEDYHAALSCKVLGTTNLHLISLETQQPISFFTILSSISGVIGNKGQANYAGGNAFEDALALHRRSMGLPAISIDLGPIEDVGVIQGNDRLEGRFNASTWFGINEGLLRRIFDYSLLQQHPQLECRLNPASQAQMITGLTIPQTSQSELLRDRRFDGLRVNQAGDGLPSGGDGGSDRELQAFFLLAQSNDADRAAVLSAAVTIVGTQLAKQLRLTEIDPARQLLQYGMDSLAAVEFRNWVRGTLRVELTTLDVVNAASLVGLCDRVVAKMGISPKS